MPGGPAASSDRRSRSALRDHMRDRERRTPPGVPTTVPVATSLSPLGHEPLSTITPGEERRRCARSSPERRYPRSPVRPRHVVVPPRDVGEVASSGLGAGHADAAADRGARKRCRSPGPTPVQGAAALPTSADTVPPHHICDFAGVLALESCYLDLLRQRPADELTRITQTMGRFAHQTGAGVPGAPTPEQLLLGPLVLLWCIINVLPWHRVILAQ